MGAERIRGDERPPESLYVVDGTFELFRCFHGAPPARDADGNEIGAARALLWTLLRLLRKRSPTHVAIAFDRVARPRSGDASAEARLRRQNPLVGPIARALGYTVWPMIRLQADDALATAAARFAPSLPVVLCTRDKDLLQCVRGDRVVVRDRQRDLTWDEDAVVARFGVRPSQIPDLHALVGDPSDGLAGLPGFGPKTAAALLQAFDSVQAIPLDPEEWPKVRGARRLAQTLAEQRDEALLQRALSERSTAVPLPQQEVEALRWPGVHRDRFEPLARRLGAEAALEKVPRWSTMA